jgi:hypothetical protein
METLTDRRYSGSAQRGASSTQSKPRAAAQRNTAPTLAVVDNVLEHGDPPRPRQHQRHWRQRVPLQRRQRAAVHPVPVSCSATGAGST